MPAQLIMPVGPSGSGKSTLFNKLILDNPKLVSFSWDTLRLQWYDPTNYTKAFEKACKDRSFHPRAEALFLTHLKKGDDLYIDNVNLNPGSRKQFLDQARKFGYQTTAYVFTVDEKLLLQRQKSRTDKSVPKQAIIQQFQRLAPPVHGDGEFDTVIVLP